MRSRSGWATPVFRPLGFKRARARMSDLTNLEKRKFERLLGMGSGYVLDFSNRTFHEFVLDTVGRDIFSDKYNLGSGSKANRLRGFWNEEPNHLTAKLLRGIIQHGHEANLFKADDATLGMACDAILARLESTQVAESDALVPLSAEKDFEAIAQEVREAINSNKLEKGVDRLHTYTVKFVRSICEKRGITVDREKPLHSLFGEYIKRLRTLGHLESDMTQRILKSSISILEAFNDVRNNRSLAHDNALLTYDESLLIFNHVAASVRFLR